MRLNIKGVQKQITYTVLTRAVSTALNFLIAVLIARYAGPAVKGDVTLLVTIASFFVFFSNILGGQALIYLIPRNKIELLVLPAYLWSVLIAVAGYFVLRLGHLVPAQYLIGVTLLSFLSSVVNINQTILLAKNRITTANLLNAFTLFIQLAGVAVCFLA